MIKMITAQGTEFEVSWAGVSDLDGSLRFEVIGAEMPILFSIFTRVFDEDRRIFEGYTGFKGIERMGTGNIVVRLYHE